MVQTNCCHQSLGLTLVDHRDPGVDACGGQGGGPPRSPSKEGLARGLLSILSPFQRMPRDRQSPLPGSQRPAQSQRHPKGAGSWTSCTKELSERGVLWCNHGAWRLPPLLFCLFMCFLILISVLWWQITQEREHEMGNLLLLLQLSWWHTQMSPASSPRDYVFIQNSKCIVLTFLCWNNFILKLLRREEMNAQ